MRTYLCFAVLSALLVSSSPNIVRAEETKIELADLKSALESLKGKDVTVQLSGVEMSGKVIEVNANMLRLGSLKGKEFFDAVVPMAQIQAVVVRSR